jgi:hypothetical protein
MITCTLWIFVVLMAIAFAPLPLDAHDEHDFQVEYQEDGTYLIVNATDFMMAPLGSDQEFRETTEGLLPFEEYNADGDRNEFTGEARVLSATQLATLLDHLDDSPVQFERAKRQHGRILRGRGSPNQSRGWAR